MSIATIIIKSCQINPTLHNLVMRRMSMVYIVLRWRCDIFGKRWWLTTRIYPGIVTASEGNPHNLRHVTRYKVAQVCLLDMWHM